MKQLKVGDLIWYVMRSYATPGSDVETILVRAHVVKMAGPKTMRAGEHTYRWRGDKYEPTVYPTPEEALAAYRRSMEGERGRAIRRQTEAEKILAEIDGGAYRVVQPRSKP